MTLLHCAKVLSPITELSKGASQLVPEVQHEQNPYADLQGMQAEGPTQKLCDLLELDYDKNMLAHSDN